MKNIDFEFTRNDIICRGSGDQFDNTDISKIREIYRSWKNLNEIYSQYNMRRATFPELLSEGLASALFGWVRTNGKQIKGLKSSSCDLIDLESGTTIQLKACSTDGGNSPGPTSFGPRTEFDRLIFLHVDCEKDIARFYELNENEYKNWLVNKNETIEDQQILGKRPRLVILPKIKQFNLKPIKVFNFKE